MRLFLFLFPLQHIKRPALQNKQVVVLRMAFRARKVFGTFEKRAQGFSFIPDFFHLRDVYAFGLSPSSMITKLHV